jgi:Membrane-bound lysozyme-inhibitor of c-type lysozyme
MRKRPYWSLALFAVFPLAALLAGCESNGGGGFDLSGLTGGDDRVEYRCDDDREMRVTYDDDERATVDAGDRTYRLELTDRDGDRREYGEDGVRLSVDGDEARLRIRDGNDYTGCEET